MALTRRDFLYGPLLDPALRGVVLGADVPVTPAVLPGLAVHWADGQAFATLAPGDSAAGVVADLPPAPAARLDHYLACLGFTGQAMAPGRVAIGSWAPGAPFDLADWALRWGDAVRATAGDVMALIGQAAPAAVGARYGVMLVRGASRARARPAPTTLRHHAAPGDVAVNAEAQPYANFFAVAEYDLAFRRFDGSLSPVVNRAVFLSGDAVTVLPYDPVRDRVLLVEQFRPGCFARGDAQPWLLEAVAGRVDPDETPETAARREAAEEARLVLGRLYPVAQYYPSPGAKSEFLYSYIGLADLPDSAATVGGLEGEAEDIRGHVISFDALMTLLDTGEAANAPLILSAMWLARHRERLRAT